MKKFKVWCHTYNEWEKDPCVLTQDGNLLQWTKEMGLVPCSPKTHTIVFSIEWRDKNEVELFEGDIVKNFYREKTIRGSKPMTELIVAKIPEIYQNKNLYIEDSIWVYGTKIGTIFENSELLEKK